MFGPTSFANYQFDRSEKDMSEEQSFTSKQQQQQVTQSASQAMVDASETKFVARSGTQGGATNSQQTIDEQNREDSDG